MQKKKGAPTRAPCASAQALQDRRSLLCGSPGRLPCFFCPPPGAASFRTSRVPSDPTLSDYCNRRRWRKIDSVLHVYQEPCTARYRLIALASRHNPINIADPARNTPTQAKPLLQHSIRVTFTGRKIELSLTVSSIEPMPTDAILFALFFEDSSDCAVRAARRCGCRAGCGAPGATTVSH